MIACSSTADTVTCARALLNGWRAMRGSCRLAAAPPWWGYQNGFVQPSIAHSMPTGLPPHSTLAALFQFNANRFAAIPSLHGAYPLLLMLVLAWNDARLRWILVSGGYAASMWFACVFLNQHYIIDLLFGAALIPFALLCGRYKLRR